VSTIGARRVDDDPRPPSMGSTVIAPTAPDTSLGTLKTTVVPKPTPEERALKAELERIAAAERQRERLEFTRTQPQVPVALADVVRKPLDANVTLADALVLVQGCGGHVRLGDAGTLRFTLPALLGEKPNEDAAIRERALAGIVTLDACRTLVYSLLKAKRELPDLTPCAGGGVA
jgi:hypothetical protein